jgi:hypothetical protein
VVARQGGSDVKHTQTDEDGGEVHGMVGKCGALTESAIEHEHISTAGQAVASAASKK